jgi:hypothetical protein
LSDLRILEVTWRDSIASGGQQSWFTPEEAIEWGRDDLQIVSCGYVVMEDKNCLVLATSRTCRNGGKLGGLWSIPKRCIIKRRRLK